MGTAMSRASDLSPEFVLLGLLAERPSYGYELHLRLKTEFQNIWALSQSQCYTILKRLEAQGALEGKLVQQERAPSRRSLRLTPAGRQRFRKWLTSPTPGSIRAIRVSFLTRLFFALQEGKIFAINIIEDQKITTRASLESLEHTLQLIPSSQVISQLSLQLRLRQLRSSLEWLDECLIAIQGPSRLKGEPAS